MSEDKFTLTLPMAEQELTDRLGVMVSDFIQDPHAYIQKRNLVPLLNAIAAFVSLSYEHIIGLDKLIDSMRQDDNVKEETPDVKPEHHHKTGRTKD